MDELPDISSQPKSFDVCFLGTGAADWGLADKNRQIHIRRNASILVNGHILIDCGPDVYEAFSTFGIAPNDITDIMFTHSHEDHFDTTTLKKILEKRTAPSPVTLWAHCGVTEILSPFNSIVKICSLNARESFEIADTDITALPANHYVKSPSQTCLHYLFENSCSKWLYAVDGAWMTTEEWHAINGKALDAIIIDATIGEASDDYRIFEHNNLPMIRQLRDAMFENSALTSDAKIYLTHLAYTLHPRHDLVASRLAHEGLTVAKDGMKIQIGPSHKSLF